MAAALRKRDEVFITVRMCCEVSTQAAQFLLIRWHQNDIFLGRPVLFHDCALPIEVIS